MSDESLDLNERLQTIGKVCVSWAYLEHLMAVCFWSLTDLEQEYAKIFTDTVEIQRRYELMMLFAPRKLNGNDVQTLASLNEKLSEVTAERNLAIHGLWKFDETGRKLSTSITRGRFKNSPQDLSLTRLKKIIVATNAIKNAIEPIFTKRGLIKSN